MKRMSVQRGGEKGLAALAPSAVRLGQAEGLPAHVRSVTIRTDTQ